LATLATLATPEGSLGDVDAVVTHAGEVRLELRQPGVRTLATGTLATGTLATGTLAPGTLATAEGRGGVEAGRQFALAGLLGLLQHGRVDADARPALAAGALSGALGNAALAALAGALVPATEPDPLFDEALAVGLELLGRRRHGRCRRRHRRHGRGGVLVAAACCRHAEDRSGQEQGT
jgi:hypothetical protein